jgi:hypothetical protein
VEELSSEEPGGPAVPEELPIIIRVALAIPLSVPLEQWLIAG